MCRETWASIGDLVSDLVGTIRLGSHSADDPHAGAQIAAFAIIAGSQVLARHEAPLAAGCSTCRWVMVVAAAGVGHNSSRLIATARGIGGTQDRSEWKEKGRAFALAEFTATWEE